MSAKDSMRVRLLVAWMKWSPITTQSYTSQCTSAAIFWSSCLEDQPDLRDRKKRKAQGRIIRPLFDSHVKRMVAQDGQDDAAVEHLCDALWTQLVKDVNVYTLLLIGRESGAISGETLNQLDSGTIGRTQAEKIATGVSKK